jgi:hypothetical protein
LLLQAKPGLAVDGLQTMRPSGRGRDLGTLFLHQHLPALAFLQHLLLCILHTVQLLYLGVLIRRFLDIPELLLAGPVELLQLGHFARRLCAKGGRAKQQAKKKSSQSKAHDCSRIAPEKSPRGRSPPSVYAQIAREQAASNIASPWVEG